MKSIPFVFSVIATSILIGPATLAQQLTDTTPTSAGNLSANFYIKPGCLKPGKVTLPKPNYDDRAGLIAYNEAVRRSNNQISAFNTCTSDYVDGATKDIDWVMFTVNTAVARATGKDLPSPPTVPGNMPSGFYPSPDCIAPDRQMGTIPNGHDVTAMDAYNAKIRAFNILAANYSACVNAYVRRAKVDIEQIEHSQKDAASQRSAQ